MRPIARTTGSAFAVLAVTALLVAGCGRDSGSSGSGGSAADPGITDTELNIGQSDALTGFTAASGSCNLAGWQAYLGRVNDGGGVEFGDGKTRTITLKGYDDGYDPARAVANFRQMQAENQFANVGSLGTPTNLAVMPQANSAQFPQALVSSGSTAFSADQDANPWTIGWQPTYLDEGRNFGTFLADSGRPLRVAVLAQNDKLGQDYTSGLESAIEGSQVEIVARATYEPTDPTVDSQVANLAQSNADILFQAVSVQKLAASALTRAQQIGWKPMVFLASLVSNPNDVIIPGGGEAYPAIYSTTFIKNFRDPQVAQEPDVAQFLQDMQEYSSNIGQENIINNCLWGYASAATFVKALEQMQEPTRQALMDAVHQVKADDVPLLLPGITVDASSRTSAPISVLKIQQYVDGRYQVAEKLQ
ncbi:amino acid-binding protein [Geodermatophilus sp. TF02-6]|uniref:ABC transporter substrate-binding protein n=1 Tax=Geodermatophilus sp. TF02-6 TaxID=2250575 RepID=UPI000DEB1D80|nr:ABC transporter substrate-binding protein [Geodermatophilus sp. TF02-6]RBY82438.1 amino acid-binding protein [Geodermatophilus sp. TF02-6]